MMMKEEEGWVVVVVVLIMMSSSIGNVDYCHYWCCNDRCSHFVVVVVVGSDVDVLELYCDVVEMMVVVAVLKLGGGDEVR